MSEQDLRARCRAAAEAVSPLTLMRLHAALASERVALFASGDIKRASGLAILMSVLETGLWTAGVPTQGGEKMFLDLVHAGGGWWPAMATMAHLEATACELRIGRALLPDAPIEGRLALQAEFDDLDAAERHVDELRAFAAFARANEPGGRT